MRVTVVALSALTHTHMRAGRCLLPGNTFLTSATNPGCAETPRDARAKPAADILRSAETQ
jgi:hypothetical protein